MEHPENDGWLGNEPDDTHPLAATAEKRVDLVDASDELLPDEFRPQGGAFGGAGWKEPPLLAGECDEIFVPAGVAPDAREAALGKAAPETTDCIVFI
jgi:hypothetical protein